MASKKRATKAISKTGSALKKKVKQEDDSID